MVQIKTFVFNALQENTYVLHDETSECLIIDPGCYDRSELHELTDYIASMKLKPIQLLNTHCHIDHVVGNAFVKDYYKIPLYISKEEESVLRSQKIFAPFYGFSSFQESEADGFIGEGEKISFGNTTLDILFVPGHSVGHLAFLEYTQKICLSGDVLFRMGVGRWDLPGGNEEVLFQSIRTKLFSLSDDMVVYPGHGPTTTIGMEKKMNPYCAL